MSDWHDVALGDVCELKRGYDLPIGSRRDGPISVVSSSGPTGWHDKAKVAAPGVVTGRYGTLGQVFYVTEDFWPLNTALYVRDFKGNDPRYVAALLRSMDLKRHDGAAAVPGLNRNQLHTLPVRVPAVPVQRAIANVVQAFDDLIENNWRRVEVLEEMARAIYREWFVNFRYPGHEDVPLVDSALGRIPEGWLVGTLADLAKISSGKRPPTRHPNSCPEAGVPVVGASSVMAYTEVALTKIRTLITGRVGTHGIVQRFQIPVWPSDNTLVLLPSHYEYTYQVMLEIDYRSLNRGSAQPLISQRDLAKVPTVVPAIQYLQRFENDAGRFLGAAQHLKTQNARASGLRNLLLPKLMTGQIDVSKLDLDGLLGEMVA